MGKSKGFIIDSANALIMTPNGDSHVVSATNGEVSFGGDSVSINGGWSTFDLIEIDTKSTIEVSLTEAQWKMRNMVLTTGGEVKTGNAEQYYFGTEYPVKTNKITIPYVVVPKSVRISGFTEVEAAPISATEFQVTIAEDSTDITFGTSAFQDGEKVTPTFKVAVENAEILSVKDNDVPPSGEVILQFPVYGKKEGVAIEGYIQITIFEGKIAKDNKVGGAYKTPSTFDMKIKGLDPQRADKNIFEIAYLPVV